MKQMTEMLKALREDNDLKQSDVAALIGTTQQQYSKYETGESELPLRALYVLADHYKVSADYLMGRTEFQHGLETLNQKYDGSYTVGALLTDALNLPAASRASVAEYVFLQRFREKWLLRKTQTSG